MKWPTMDEFAKSVAEKALDEIEYNGKTIRQWVEIIAASELGTNLASLGTDCISRQAAIDALRTCYDTETITMDNGYEYIHYGDAVGEIEQLPPIQPKRGRWHYSDGKPARIGLSFGVICDQCGTESEYCTNFCGECGADMRGEQDG